MFLHVSVILFMSGVISVRRGVSVSSNPPGQSEPPYGGREGGTHPTGMLFLFVKIRLVELRLTTN